MKIANSNIALASSYKQEKQTIEKESLIQWFRAEDAPNQIVRGSNTFLSNNLKSLNISDKELIDEPQLDPKLMQIVRALEALMGKKIKIVMPYSQDSREPNGQSELQGWGIDYSYSKTETSRQELNFSAKGSIALENGKTIDFKLMLSMKSESIKSESITFKGGDALIDPLVINFGNEQVSFSDIKQNLDLDLDGNVDEFNFINSSSGFLALDKNEDGQINDGSELFGPNSGNGFRDLKEYDNDKNGWIDENDSVFDKLLIWTKDSEGKDTFYSLKDKGIGALYLESVTTKFDFEKGEELFGKMAESSVFLRENGSVGVINELDIKI
ncbi:hypothetical protein JHD49_02525 [Sulfurimonas sp. SAG-AH-194-C21]|nr:hypothetical protein [Sulfurimonas sp. SAG-AH-194-C21]MDF1882808.1 hypothetical protein [Sulfurimonas sp. SAG-AH-194-C21]